MAVFCIELEWRDVTHDAQLILATAVILPDNIASKANLNNPEVCYMAAGDVELYATKLLKQAETPR